MPIGLLNAQCYVQIGDLTVRYGKIDRVRSAQADHRFDMEILLLLTHRRKCSLILDLSNQSGQIGWLRQPEYHVDM